MIRFAPSFAPSSRCIPPYWNIRASAHAVGIGEMHTICAQNANAPVRPWPSPRAGPGGGGWIGRLILEQTRAGAESRDLPPESWKVTSFV
ncbi:hypothetical protein AAFF_G00159010 [Aldrovandia affinis]|uniref:Uncharacterized protein n=1 Tax=Aldrovandia affinis TaxID=143900 RepID=A0AAD7RMZ9_9TELE|nr:hypothetical protein AAFF_G00159010 [Aldrovandia affinis]